MQLQNLISLFENYPLYIQLTILLGLGTAVAALVSTLLLFILRSSSKQFNTPTIARISQQIRSPLLGILKTLVYLLGAWLLIRLIRAGADGIRSQYEEDNNTSIKERKILTQLQYLEQIALIIIAIIAIALVLLQFENVKNLGATILTSAGVTGIIVGLAAQKSIANLLAGFQIAFTQPIRINDRLLVKGEFGQVEDITLTYVVLKIWDERRMIIPLQHFIDNAFENWTHTNSQLLGSVFVFTDYSFPVDELRSAFHDFLATKESWDGRVANVLVTDASANSMQIRLLVSAADAGTLFGLRCEVREYVIAYIRDHHPESLPKVRVMSLGESDKQHPPLSLPPQG